jgi:peptidylprolyl isomerase
MRRLLILLAGSALVAAACSPNDEPMAEATASTTAPPETIASVAPAGDASGNAADYATTTTDEGRPGIDVVANPPAAPSSFIFDDVVVGDGRAAEAGDLIEVNYVGVTLETGEEFDASWNRDQTFLVPIGVGNLIEGWDLGLLGMTEGTRRLLVIPPDQGYGARGAGAAIGPNATLVFVVDLLRVIDTPVPDVPDITEAGATMEIIDVTVGDGELVESGDTITVNYQGNLLDGTIFDSSWSRGQPFTTVIGVGQVIQGWDQGMVGMREGGRRILVIPSDLAYGNEGSGAIIAPNSPLVFVVDLLQVQG